MILAGFPGQVGSWSLVVLGVGLLIFIHEAGHFLVAKWAGVRVLVFSMGFGPEMWGFTRGPTRYRVGWLPLGGYVKMSGEVEREEGGYAPDDYPAQTVGKRSLIIGAGVAMNGVLGFVLFAAALVCGLPQVVVSDLVSGGPAWRAGVRPGDRVLRAGGERVLTFPELQFAAMAGEPLDLLIERDGRARTLRVAPEAGAPRKPAAIGVFGYPEGEPGRRLVVPPGGTAEKAGFRDGDEVVAVEGFPAGVDDLGDPIFEATVDPPGRPLRITVAGDGGTRVVELPRNSRAPKIGIAPLAAVVGSVRPDGPAARAGWRPGDRPVSVGGRAVDGFMPFRTAVLRAEPGPATVRVLREEAPAELPLPESPGERLGMLRDLHFPTTTAVEVLAEGPPGPGGEPRPSPAAAAGIPPGARITSVGGTPVTRYEEVAARIRASQGTPIEIAWATDKGEKRATVTPADYPDYGFAGLDLEPTAGDQPLVVPGALEIPGLALGRCVSTTRQILATIAGIFRGSVDKSNLGGPILIAQVAHRETRSGAGPFLWLLAVLSINLMFLNILPIPLLDGGQLALLGVEAVTRKPPSEAIVGISQMVGLVLILGLFVMVTFNDIVRIVAN